MAAGVQDLGHIKYYCEKRFTTTTNHNHLDTTMMIIRTTILLLLVFATMPAFAQESALDAEIQALKTYCKPDIERLCSNVEPGGGQIKECLMAQKEELTVGCAQALQELKKIKQSR